MLALIDSFASPKLDSIAAIRRTFNALSSRPMRCKPFHNQLAKPGFAAFVQEMFSRLLGELAGRVLCFSPESRFKRVGHIRIHDGTSLQLHSALADVYPGRFRATHPAAVELHVELDLLSEVPQCVVLTPDYAPERPCLPPPHDLVGDLLLCDRGYCAKDTLRAFDKAGAAFIMRSKTDINPLIIRSLDSNGHEPKHLRGKRLS